MVSGVPKEERRGPMATTSQMLRHEISSVLLELPGKFKTYIYIYTDNQKSPIFQTILIFNMRFPGNQVCLLQGSHDTSDKVWGRGWGETAVRQDRL